VSASKPRGTRRSIAILRVASLDFLFGEAHEESARGSVRGWPLP
jgi:hypothetical protein